ncbi:inositol-tetrakisphosphate 1-kinase-like [Branchiostoma floridae x Branchiostoma japonicum]
MLRKYNAQVLLSLVCLTVIMTVYLSTTTTWLCTQPRKQTFRQHKRLCRVYANRSVAAQGPFDVFIYDLENIADEDTQAETLMTGLKDYVSLHPDMVVANRLASWRLLHDRLGAQGVAAEVVKLLNDPDITVPHRVYLEQYGVENIMRTLEDSGVTFPFVCKSSSADRHRGKRGEPTRQTRPVSDEKVSRMSHTTRRVLGSSLFGIDVIVQDGTGNHVIIDVNDFPSFQEVGIVNFQSALLQHLKTDLCR